MTAQYTQADPGTCCEVNYFPARDDFRIVFNPGQPDEAEFEVVYPGQLRALLVALAQALFNRGDVEADEEVDDEWEEESDQ